MKKQIKIILLVLLLIIVVVGYYFNSQPGKYDELAQCLTEGDAKIYGTYWCSNCADQKKLFGKSWKLINYVECSLPNREGITPLCEKEEIEGYPTWEFADGSRIAGFINFEPKDELEQTRLNEFLGKSGCEL